MDFIKQLIELNNKIELEKIAKELYQSDSEDEEEEVLFTNGVRENFCKQYDKRNNRQFKLIRINK